MKVYRTDEIRNVVLLGHGGSGKTSLVEAMAYVSGAISRMGKVTDGNTISDFDKEEQNVNFNQYDTGAHRVGESQDQCPGHAGYFDFVGEVEEAVSARRTRRSSWFPQGRRGGRHGEGLGAV